MKPGVPGISLSATIAPADRSVGSSAPGRGAVGSNPAMFSGSAFFEVNSRTSAGAGIGMVGFGARCPVGGSIGTPGASGTAVSGDRPIARACAGSVSGEVSASVLRLGATGALFGLFSVG